MAFRFVFFAAFFSLILSGTAKPYQNRPKENASGLSGTVFDQVTKVPLEQVLVTLTPQSGTPYSVLTDREGKFAVDSLTSGSYRIVLTHKNFAEPREKRGPRYMTLSAGEQINGVRFELVPRASISGRILGEDGQPMDGVVAFALKSEYLNGRRVLTTGGLTTRQLLLQIGSTVKDVPQAKIDQRGEYRLYGLEPGEYYIGVWSTKALSAMPPTYYPGVTNPAAAVPINILGGMDMPSINIRLSPSKLFTARFKVIPPSLPPYDCSTSPFPSALKSFVLIQRTDNMDVVHFTTLGTQATSGLRDLGNNIWSTPKLAPGSYEIFHSSCAQVFGIAGHLNFDIVDRDIDAGVLEIPASVLISGRVTTPTGTTLPPDQIQIRLRPLDGRGYSAVMTPTTLLVGAVKIPADGRFSFKAGSAGTVSPGQYHLDISGIPQNLYVASIRYGGQDVMQSGVTVERQSAGSLDILLGASAGRVNVTVLNSRGEPVSDSQVVLVPQESRKAPIRGLKIGQTDQRGTVSISGLKPGNYLVFATDINEEAAYESPEFIDKFRVQAKNISVLEGAHLDLRIQQSNVRN
jgi:hypothetical protein